MKQETEASALLTGAAKSASYSMILQLMIRMMTFGLNAFVLRYISRDMLGVVNVRLTLLYSTIIFLATEAFNKACLSKIEGQSWPKVINLAWCMLPASIVFSAVLGWLWLFVLDPPDPDLVPHYGYGVISFALSTVIVALSQPLFVVGQICLFVKLKVLVIGVGELVKCCLTVVLIVCCPQFGLINFAIAQLVYGVVTSCVYYIYFLWYINCRKDDDFPFTSAKQFFPQKEESQPWIDRNQTNLTISILKQSFLKQLLTEGEKYVMTLFGILSFADQGVYDVVNNLGSMAARFIFLPIEESGYLFFSQLLVRGEPLEKQKQDSISMATDVLRYLIKMVILVGSVILVFGYSYSHLALDLYGGTLLSSGSGPLLLRWFCLYVLVIAINGTTECFVFATMSKAQVDKYNKKMLLFSALFLLSSLALTRQFGSIGFILANCLNMGARITHSIYYIKQFFKNSSYKPLSGVVPALPVLLSLGISFAVTTVSEIWLCCESGVANRFIHILIGGLCLLCVLLAIYITESSLITFIKQQFIKSKQRHKKVE